MIQYCPAHDLIAPIVAIFCLAFVARTPRRRRSDWAVIATALLYLSAQSCWIFQQYHGIILDEQNYIWTLVEISTWGAIWLLIRRKNVTA